MRFLVPIFYNVKSVISSLPLKEWQKMLQTIKKIKFVESRTYESVKFLFMKINCQLYKSQTYEICTRLHKIYKLDNFRAKSCTTWSENYCEYFWLYESQMYEVCTRLFKIYVFDNFRAKSCTNWNENFC